MGDNFKRGPLKATLRIILSESLSLVPHIVALLPMLLIIVLVDVSITGNDTMTHAVKALVLKHQMVTLPPWLWGVWDWSWYLGNPFLRSYSPLGYLLIALLAFIFPLNIAVRILLSSVPILSYISTYKVLMRLTGDKRASMVFAVAYTYSPAIFVTTWLWGSIGQSLSMVVIPWHVLFLSKLSAEERKSHYEVKIAATLSIMMLLNMAIGFWMTVLTAVWLVVKRDIPGLIRVGLISAALTGFFLYDYFTLEGTPLPATSVSSERGWEWMCRVLQLSMLEIYVMAIMYTFVFLSIIYVRACRLGRFKKVFWVRVLKYHLLIMILVLALSALDIEWFSVAGGDRTFTVLCSLGLMICAYYVSEMDRRAAIALSLMMLAVSAVICGIFVKSAVSLQRIHNRIYPDNYGEIYERICDDDCWYRTLDLPQEYWGAMAPLYTNHPTVCGWYPQSLPPEVFEVLGCLVMYDKHAYLERSIINNPIATIRLLRYLGVKYIIVERDDPIFPELSEKILETLLRVATSTNEITLIEVCGSRYLFRVENFTPVFALSYIPRSLDEIPPHSDPLLYVHVIQKEDMLRVEVSVNRSSWVIIPVLVDPYLEVKMDGKVVEDFEVAYPKIYAIRVSEGSHVIEIRVHAMPLRNAIVSISAIAWMCSLVYLFRQELLRGVSHIRRFTYRKNRKGGFFVPIKVSLFPR